jgi:hypothetical protein
VIVRIPFVAPLFAQFAKPFELRVKILLDDGRLRRQRNILFEAAVRALELLLPDMKREVGPATLAGEDTPLVVVDGLPGRLRRRRAVFFEDR